MTEGCSFSAFAGLFCDALTVLSTASRRSLTGPLSSRRRPAGRGDVHRRQPPPHSSGGQRRGCLLGRRHAGVLATAASTVAYALSRSVRPASRSPDRQTDRRRFVWRGRSQRRPRCIHGPSLPTDGNSLHSTAPSAMSKRRRRPSSENLPPRTKSIISCSRAAISAAACGTRAAISNGIFTTPLRSP